MARLDLGIFINSKQIIPCIVVSAEIMLMDFEDGWLIKSSFITNINMILA